MDTDPDIHTEIEEWIKCIWAFVTSKTRNCFHIALMWIAHNTQATHNAQLAINLMIFCINNYRKRCYTFHSRAGTQSKVRRCSRRLNDRIWQWSSHRIQQLTDHKNQPFMMQPTTGLKMAWGNTYAIITVEHTTLSSVSYTHLTLPTILRV